MRYVVDMKTTHMISAHAGVTPDDAIHAMRAIAALDETAIIALFDGAGLKAEIVAHCDDPTCPACTTGSHARAA
jgi:hypothetical protein